MTTYVTAAALAPLPELRGISTEPLDPACPGDRHGSYRAYSQHHCRCPDVMAYMVAYRVRREAREAERLAAQPPPPDDGPQPRSPFDVDEGDVQAALWRAWRWQPLPARLTPAEVRTVVGRLRDAGLTAEGIAARIRLSERTVQRLFASCPTPPGEAVDADDELVAA